MSAVHEWSGSRRKHGRWTHYYCVHCLIETRVRYWKACKVHAQKRQSHRGSE